MTDPIQVTTQPPTAETTIAPSTSSQTIYPSVEQIMQVCPQADINNVKQYAPQILKALAVAGFTSKNQLIGAIATIYTEVRRFAPIEEDGRGKGQSYSPYYGRGLIQLTWLDNYKSAEKDLGIVGLVATPDLALDAENSARIFAWYWGGATGNNPSKAAESGNWREVRRSVNGGYHGWDVFNATVQRGLEIFTQDLDPEALGALPLDGSYGLGCADTGGAGTHRLSGVNANSQGDALMIALGLHSQTRQHGFKFTATLNVSALPDVMKLDAQKKFNVAGIDDKSNGEYTAEEVIFYPLAPGGIEAYLVGTKPDPDAPPTQIFLHDTNQGLSTAQLPSAPPTGDIPGKIYEAAIAHKGKSSASGPGGGNVACAWAVNLFCILPAGLANIGDIKGQDGVTVAVKNMTKALEGGRGQKVSREQSVKGDIWISPGEGHVGIVVADGGRRVLSNSSSRAAFAWEGDIDKVNRYYGLGKEHGIYRVLR